MSQLPSEVLETARTSLSGLLQSSADRCLRCRIWRFAQLRSESPCQHEQYTGWRDVKGRTTESVAGQARNLRLQTQSSIPRAGFDGRALRRRNVIVAYCRWSTQGTSDALVQDINRPPETVPAAALPEPDLVRWQFHVHTFHDGNSDSLTDLWIPTRQR